MAIFVIWPAVHSIFAMMDIDCKVLHDEIAYERLSGHQLCRSVKVSFKPGSQYDLILTVLIFVTGINCGHLPNLSNGVISVRKVAGIEQAEFTCNENYYLEGPKQRTCLSNGTWSGVDPECISKYLSMSKYILFYSVDIKLF